MTVHVYPVDDIVDHELAGTECVCGPVCEYVDPETDETYANGPVVVHHSLDGREGRKGDTVRSTRS